MPQDIDKRPKRHKELGEFGHLFVRGDGDGALKLTSTGASQLLPRLARQNMAFPVLHSEAQAREFMHELGRRELRTGMNELDALLSRDDLSPTEREILEALNGWNTSEPVQPAPSGNRSAKVYDLSAYRAASGR